MFLLACCSNTYVTETIARRARPRRNQQQQQTYQTITQTSYLGRRANRHLSCFLLVPVFVLFLAMCGNCTRAYRERHNAFDSSKVVKIWSEDGDQRRYLCVRYARHRNVTMGTLYWEKEHSRNSEVQCLPTCHNLFNVHYTNQPKKLILEPYVDPTLKRASSRCRNDLPATHQRLHIHTKGRRRRKTLPVKSLNFEAVAKAIRSRDSDFEFEYVACPVRNTSVADMPEFRIRIRTKLAYVKLGRDGQAVVKIHNRLLKSIVRGLNETGNQYDAFFRRIYEHKCTHRQIVNSLQRALPNSADVVKYKGFLDEETSLFHFEETAVVYQKG